MKIFILGCENEWFEYCLNYKEHKNAITIRNEVWNILKGFNTKLFILYILFN